MPAFKLRVADARRIPHPVLPQVEKHYFLVRAADIPKGILLDANPRDAEGRDLNRRTYRQVRASLFNETSYPGTFDLMNKGITCIAETVKKLSEHDYEITIEEGGGIADGGHTYRLLVDCVSDPALPKDQYVEMRVMTGIQPFLVPDIAKGLNTGMQVKEFAIENLKGNYDWIKKLIEGEPYENLIAWRENEDKEYDVSDLLCLLETMNVHDYPNDSGKHPYSAYEKSSAVLRSFAEDAEKVDPKTGERSMKYRAYEPIFKDVLVLYDRIRCEFREFHNLAGGSGGKLKIMDEGRGKTKKLAFPFAGLPSEEYRLNNGAALPILAAFRNLVRINPKSGKAEWVGGFEFVKKVWEKFGPELVNVTVQATKEHGRSPNQIGKARSHWSLLHLIVDRRAASLTTGSAKAPSK